MEQLYPFYLQNIPVNKNPKNQRNRRSSKSKANIPISIPKKDINPNTTSKHKNKETNNNIPQERSNRFKESLQLKTHLRVKSTNIQTNYAPILNSNFETADDYTQNYTTSSLLEKNNNVINSILRPQNFGKNLTEEVEKVITQSQNNLDKQRLNFVYNTHSQNINSNNSRDAFSLSPSQTSRIAALLPPKAAKYKDKKTLVLDLDETLVHSGFKQYNASVPSTVIMNLNLLGAKRDVHVLVRPHVDVFLQRMSNLFEIVIFTASLSNYANPVIDFIDPSNVCAHRLFREHCTNVNGIYIKDLKRLNRNLKELIILDNSPVAYALHPENGLPIKTWMDDQSDCELLNIAPVIEFLSFVKDVREFIPSMVENNQLSMKKAMDIISNFNKNLNRKLFSTENVEKNDKNSEKNDTNNGSNVNKKNEISVSFNANYNLINNINNNTSNIINNNFYLVQLKQKKKQDYDIKNLNKSTGIKSITSKNQLKNEENHVINYKNIAEKTKNFITNIKNISITKLNSKSKPTNSSQSKQNEVSTPEIQKKFNLAEHYFNTNIIRAENKKTHLLSKTNSFNGLLYNKNDKKSINPNFKPAANLHYNFEENKSYKKIRKNSNEIPLPKKDKSKTNNQFFEAIMSAQKKILNNNSIQNYNTNYNTNFNPNFNPNNTSRERTFNPKKINYNNDRINELYKSKRSLTPIEQNQSKLQENKLLVMHRRIQTGTSKIFNNNNSNNNSNILNSDNKKNTNTIISVRYYPNQITKNIKSIKYVKTNKKNLNSDLLSKTNRSTKINGDFSSNFCGDSSYSFREKKKKNLFYSSSSNAKKQKKYINDYNSLKINKSLNAKRIQSNINSNYFTNCDAEGNQESEDGDFNSLFKSYKTNIKNKKITFNDSSTKAYPKFSNMDNICIPVPNMKNKNKKKDFREITT